MVTQAPSDALRSSVHRVRTLFVVAIVFVMMGSLSVWYLTRDTTPANIRIATAAPGGLYYRVASVLAPHLEQETGGRVTVLETLGSVENRQLLETGDAHLAILQNGTVDLPGLVALTPLYRDVIQVVVRSGRRIATVRDLAGRRVAIGAVGSGMRQSAMELLEHYRVDLSSMTGTEGYFLDLLTDESLDAAIITSGLLNPDLRDLMATGEFELLPILDAEALTLSHAHFTAAEIPRGFYREGPPVPPEPVLTVATTSFIAAREDISGSLVSATLHALYDNYMRDDIPTLLTRTEAEGWNDLPLHGAARDYFQPYGGLGILANLMESLAALKELLFAIGAGLYLLWLRWQRLKQQAEVAAMLAEKDYLDEFLRQTMEIERSQMRTDDPGTLRGFLDRVTEIKLRALEELTNEDLRADLTFSIFLQQCANLIRKIQAKLAVVVQGQSYPVAAVPGGGHRGEDSDTR